MPNRLREDGFSMDRFPLNDGSVLRLKVGRVRTLEIHFSRVLSGGCSRIRSTYGIRIVTVANIGDTLGSVRPYKPTNFEEETR